MTTGPEIDDSPDFSNDGTLIAISRQEADGIWRVMIANADGSNMQPLAIADWQWREFSPDGTLLAFAHEVDGRPTISVVSTDGSGTIRQLDTLGVEPMNRVRWRPTEGSELIFIGRPQPGGSVQGLYSITPDGTGLREIGSPWTDGTSDGGGFQDLQVSPDGSMVAYWRWEANDSGITDAYAHFRDLVTGVDRRVEAYFMPRFSPDGTLVVGEAPGQLVLAPADGSQSGRPIGPPYAFRDRQDFGFSPDGTKVWLTVGDPAVMWLIDVVSGEGVATNVGAHPSWQRMAR